MTRVFHITSVTLLAFIFVQLSCKDKAIDPPEGPPTKAGCPFVHVEVDDTTREYKSRGGTIYNLNTSYVFARFTKETTDTVAVALANQYGLKRKFHAAGVWVFCVPEGRRAEEYFTPYGKPEKQTFGSDSLVEVAYAIFENGSFGYVDELIVEFDSTITQTSIDSINAIYNVVLNHSYMIGDRTFYNLRVTKNSSYGSFDMARLYYCLKEVINAAPNINGFIPSLGEKCIPIQN